jgi:hypothetical protein
LLFAGAGFLFAATMIGVAQGHNNGTEKTVRATIILASDVKFGDKLLRAGEHVFD